VLPTSLLVEERELHSRENTCALSEALTHLNTVISREHWRIVGVFQKHCYYIRTIIWVYICLIYYFWTINC